MINIDAMNLLKIISVGESDIRNGRTYTQDEIDSDIRAILEEPNYMRKAITHNVSGKSTRAE